MSARHMSCKQLVQLPATVRDLLPVVGAKAPTASGLPTLCLPSAVCPHTELQGSVNMHMHKMGSHR